MRLVTTAGSVGVLRLDRPLLGLLLLPMLHRWWSRPRLEKPRHPQRRQQRQALELSPRRLPSREYRNIVRGHLDEDDSNPYPLFLELGYE